MIELDIEVLDELDAPTWVRLLVFDSENKLVLKNVQSPVGFYFFHRTKIHLVEGAYALVFDKGPEYKVERLFFRLKKSASLKIKMKKFIQRPPGWFCGSFHSHVARGDRLVNVELMLAVLKAAGYDFFQAGPPFPESHNFEQLKKFFEKYNFYLLPGIESPKGRLGHLNWIGKGVPYIHDPEYDRWQLTGRRGPEPSIPYYNWQVLKKYGSSERFCFYCHPTSWWWEGKNFVTNIAAELAVDTFSGPLYDGIVIQGYDAFNPYVLNLWYSLLNLGLKITGVSEVDSSFAGKIPKICKFFNYTYVETGCDFSLKTLIKALKSGRAFVTSGPLLFVKANGKSIGELLPPGEISFEVVFANRNGLEKAEFIKCGKTVHTWKFEKGQYVHKEIFRFRMNSGEWCIFKLKGAGPQEVAFTNPFYIEPFKPCFIPVKNPEELFKAAREDIRHIYLGSFIKNYPALKPGQVPLEVFGIEKLLKFLWRKKDARQGLSAGASGG